MSNDKLNASEQSQLYGFHSLPLSYSLSVDKLSAGFSSVTNSYKYYWFLALLQEIQHGDNNHIPMNKLLSRMLSLVWYPVNYFRLSFGKQDRLSSTISRLLELSELSQTSSEQDVFAECLELLEGSKYKQQKALNQELSSFSRYVPYRFLRPWYAEQLRGTKDSIINQRIAELSNESFSLEDDIKPLYRLLLSDQAIEIHPEWFIYIRKHIRILQDFCLWNLVAYLQRKNPNTPGIASKLFAPQTRELKQAKQFWDLALDHSEVTMSCIYSDNPITQNKYSLDHFLPWSFVTHDLIWNLIPTSTSVNSSKSDKLPCPTSYLNKFCMQQYHALQIVGQHGSKRLLEDYLLLYQEDSFTSLISIDYDSFSEVLKNTISPQLQLAENMGFEGRWIYREN